MHKELNAYYQKMRNANFTAVDSLNVKKNDYSLFYKNILLLVKQTSERLGRERPWWNSGLWDERQIQLNILFLSLENARMISHNDDSALYFDCSFVKQHSTKSWNPLSVYNDFVYRLEEIVDSIKMEQVHTPSPVQVYKIENELEATRKELAETIIQRVKMAYIEKLKESSELSLLEKKLESGSAKEVLSDLVMEITAQVSAELEIVKSHYDTNCKILISRQAQLQQIILKVMKELEHSESILREFYLRYPKEYQSVYAELIETDKDEREWVSERSTFSDREVSQYMSRFGFEGTTNTSSSKMIETPPDLLENPTSKQEITL